MGVYAADWPRHQLHIHLEDNPFGGYNRIGEPNDLSLWTTQRPFQTCQASGRTKRHLDLSLRNCLCCFLLPLRPPARKRRSLFDNVSSAPQHSLLVCFLGSFVIGADNVKFVFFHLLIQEVGDLLRSPCARRLFLGLASPSLKKGIKK